MKTYISKNQNDTINIAKQLAKDLKKDDIIVLQGELGAGKTKFTEGILTYFGLQDDISSPTFTLVNEYKTKDVSIFHFDLYRLSNIDDFLGFGGDEYLGNGICIIEWADIIKELLPPNTIFINLKKDNNDENLRIIEIN